MGKFDKDSLGTRMKSYEAITDNKLIPRMAMIIRLDGCAFHTFTRGMKKPFDEIFLESMRMTMLELCKEVSTCKFGYTQSDEITLVCCIDDVKKSEGYMGYEINKILSKTAAMCTLFFNKYFEYNVLHYVTFEDNEKVDKDVYERKFHKAFFDCRVFNVPDWEVVNNLIWRQQDCTRNSLSSLARAHFSHKELQGKNSVTMQDMLMEKGINWNDLEIRYKRGVCCYKVQDKGWFLDYYMPILTEEVGKELVNDKVFSGREI